MSIKPGPKPIAKSTGKPEKYNNGKRIYEINKNGILKTQFKFQEGFRDIDYKYSNGKVIRYLWPSDRVWKDTINLNSKYILRYKYLGNFNLSLQNTRALNRNTSIAEEFTGGRTYMINWSHSMDAKQDRELHFLRM